MPKLVITREGVNLREYKLDRKRVTIGRKSDNDVFLDDQTVSSEHAVVELERGPSIVDMGSTNGTLVNGLRITQQTLNHGDVIRIGQHELKFIDERVQDFNATVVLNPGTAQRTNARLHVLTGVGSGTAMSLDQERTVIGKPGGDLAVVFREGTGFRLLPATAGAKARVNQRPLSAQGVILKEGDEIEIAESRIRFEEK